MSGRNRLYRRAIPALVGVAAISGCAMPRSATSLHEVQSASAAGQIQLVPVTAATVPPPAPELHAMFPAELTNASEYAYDRLAPGDRLSVRIYESGTPTVFTQNGGGTDLGEVVIDDSGRLFVPYAGAFRVTGMTIPEVRAAVTRKLRTVVLDPQVDIRPIDSRGRLVSVQGTAAKTGSFPIERGRTRLGALLADVAPDQKNPEMLNVTVRRGDTAGTARLSDIYANPDLDIALRPGDSIILRDVVEHVTVLGAAGVQGQVQVPKRDFNVMEALGEARGLNEDAADPRAVFLMRAQADPAAPPIVYQFDMRRPETVLLARRFIVHDNDAILISSAPFAQTRKVLSAFAQSLTGLRSATLMVP
jgi:polysaccharide export outer membrane protein